jgi:hypothetical protein
VFGRAEENGTFGVFYFAARHRDVGDNRQG